MWRLHFRCFPFSFFHFRAFLQFTLKWLLSSQFIYFGFYVFSFQTRIIYFSPIVSSVVAEDAFIRWFISIRFIALSISSLIFLIALLARLIVSFTWLYFFLLLELSSIPRKTYFSLAYLYRTIFYQLHFSLIFIIFLYLRVYLRKTVTTGFSLLVCMCVL